MRTLRKELGAAGVASLRLTRKSSSADNFSLVLPFNRSNTLDVRAHKDTFSQEP